MRKVLTEKEIKQYNDEGFIAPIRVMSEDEAIKVRERVEEAEKSFPEEFNPENRNNLHLTFMVLDELAHNPIILDAVEDLIGSKFSLWSSVMFIKNPSTEHFVSWHQDATYMGMSSNDFLTPWIALTPSTEEMGCMSMIPGSHKQNILPHQDTFAENNILTRGQVVKNVNAKKAVNLILKPGEMSIHHGAIIHCSKPNKSKQRRIGFALQSYCPHDINQIIGKNIWMHIRGGKRDDLDGLQLERPPYDMAPLAVNLRNIANDNYSNILYDDAKITRNY